MKELEKLDEMLANDAEECLLKRRYLDGYLDCLSAVRSRLRRIINDKEEQKEVKP